MSTQPDSREPEQKKVIASTQLGFVKNLAPYSVGGRSTSPTINRGGDTIMSSAGGNRPSSP